MTWSGSRQGPELVLCHGERPGTAKLQCCSVRRPVRERGRWLLTFSAVAFTWALLGSRRALVFTAASGTSPGVVAGRLRRFTSKGEPSAERNGLQLLALGVPKVAYRIPGAQTAEWVDIYTRLYRERIIFLGKEIDDRVANEIIGVLLYLDSEDNKKPIYLYINSSGGSVIAGLAIYDTMQHIKSPVVTINVGLAASMASFLLASGEKGKRLALPHSRTMIHQAMGSAQGQAEDIRVEAQQILQIHENLVRMYAQMTGKPADVIREDLQRDNFMSAREAKEYGLIDQIIEPEDMDSLTEREARQAVPAPITESDSAPEVRRGPSDLRDEAETKPA